MDLQKETSQITEIINIIDPTKIWCQICGEWKDVDKCQVTKLNDIPELPWLVICEECMKKTLLSNLDLRCSSFHDTLYNTSPTCG